MLKSLKTGIFLFEVRFLREVSGVLGAKWLIIAIFSVEACPELQLCNPYIDLLTFMMRNYLFQYVLVENSN